MTPEEAAALRAPFPDSAVGKLPKGTCRACSDSRTKVCAEHKKAKCPRCGNYMTTAHIDLDYVGHAATTDRLLKVDPLWTWRPMVTDMDTGKPHITDGGLWILLTVAGVTRPGWGDGKNIKEMIGDAIRNAAMRFGVALDLWAKEDLSELHADITDGQVIAQTIIDAHKPDDEPAGKMVNTVDNDDRGEIVNLPPVAQIQPVLAPCDIDPDLIDFTKAEVGLMTPPKMLNKLKKLGIKPAEGTPENWRDQLMELATG